MLDPWLHYVGFVQMHQTHGHISKFTKQQDECGA